MRLRGVLLAIAFIVSPLAGAQAEPQILALLETPEPTALNCANGECAAEFTSFCMEKPRASPLHLTAYQTIPGADDIRVVGWNAAGESIPLSPEALNYSSKRGFAAVRVSIERQALERAGITRVTVGVGSRVALRPIPSPSYQKPHEPEEVATAIGPLRELGERIVDHGGYLRQTAGLVRKLINALPEAGAVSPERRAGLWRETLTDADTARAGTRAITRARAGYEKCLSRLERGESGTLGHCLGRLHDMQVWPLTRQYWIQSLGS